MDMSVRPSAPYARALRGLAGPAAATRERRLRRRVRLLDQPCLWCWEIVDNSSGEEIDSSTHPANRDRSWLGIVRALLGGVAAPRTSTRSVILAVFRRCPARLARFGRPEGVPILVYHRFGPAATMR
jgi:hypothetical protein